MNATEVTGLTMDDVTTADDLLTVLHGIPVSGWADALQSRRGAAWTRLLRGAADLCGVDSEGMTRLQAVRAIVAEF